MYQRIHLFICLLLLNLLLASHSYAQSSTDGGWITAYYHPGNNFFNQPVNIVTADNGDYIVGGNMFVFPSGNGPATMHVIDKKGNIKNQKYYGSTNSYSELYDFVRANSVSENYIGVGHTNVPGQTSGMRAWLIKTDKSGIPNLQKTYTSDSGLQTLIRKIAPGKDPGEQMLLLELIPVNNGIGFSFVRISENGEIVSQKSYAYNNTLILGNLLKTRDGGYLISGTLSTSGNFILKVDSTGTFQWARKYESPVNLTISKIAETQGGYYVAGNLNEAAASDGQIFIMKISTIGNVIWHKQYDLVSNFQKWERVEDITINNGKEIILSGTFVSNSNNTTAMYISKFDKDGNFKWIKSYAKPFSSSGFVSTAYDGANFATAAWGPSYDTSLAPSIWVIKTPDKDSANQSCYSLILSPQNYTLNIIDKTIEIGYLRETITASSVVVSNSPGQMSIPEQCVF